MEQDLRDLLTDIRDELRLIRAAGPALPDGLLRGQHPGLTLWDHERDLVERRKLEQAMLQRVFTRRAERQATPDAPAAP